MSDNTGGSASGATTATSPYHRLAAWLRREWPGLVGLAIIVLLAIWVRGDSLLSGNVLNADEAELLAEGKRAALSWVPYATSTDTTHLYPWAFGLGMLARLGFNLELPLAHLLSALAYVVVLGSVWWVLYRRVSVLTAALAVGGPALVLLTARDSPDFASMSSELLPVVLLAVAILVAFGPRASMGRARFATAMVLVGIAPIAKPQALLLAFAIWVVLAAHWTRLRAAQRGPTQSTWRRWAEAAGWSLIPSAVLILAMIAGGTFSRFVSEPVAFNLHYLVNRNGGNADVDLSITGRLAALSTHFGAIMVCLLPLFAAGSAKRGAILLRPSAWASTWRRPAAALLGISLAGFLAVAITPPYFPHYQVLIYAGALFAAACSSSIATSPQSPAPWLPAKPRGIAALPLMAILFLATAVPLAPRFATFPSWPSGWSALWGARPDESADYIPSPEDPWAPVATDCPAGSTVLVWGWVSELYSWRGWEPASRYVNSGWVLNDSPRLQTYRQRLFQEVESDPPRCIVNAVGPQWFAWYPESATFEATMVAARAWLRRCYVAKRVQLPDRPLRYFVRRPSCERPR